jgi:hypothetical protein
VMVETDQGLFILGHNARKRFWDGFGCEGVAGDPEGNRDRAARALWLQGRGAIARSFSEARAMVDVGLVEVADGSCTVCTVGLDEFRSQRFEEVEEAFARQNAAPAFEEKEDEEKRSWSKFDRILALGREDVLRETVHATARAAMLSSS